MNSIEQLNQRKRIEVMTFSLHGEQEAMRNVLEANG